MNEAIKNRFTGVIIVEAGKYASIKEDEKVAPLGGSMSLIVELPNGSRVRRGR